MKEPDVVLTCTGFDFEFFSLGDRVRVVAGTAVPDDEGPLLVVSMDWRGGKFAMALRDRERFLSETMVQS